MCSLHDKSRRYCNLYILLKYSHRHLCKANLNNKYSIYISLPSLHNTRRVEIFPDCLPMSILTGRIFFTCPPTSNLNNIISYLFSHKATLMYKILRAYFTKLNDININYNLRNLETDLALPRPRTNFLKRSFKYSTRQK